MHGTLVVPIPPGGVTQEAAEPFAVEGATQQGATLGDYRGVHPVDVDGTEMSCHTWDIRKGELDVDALLDVHRRTFGDARMDATGGGDEGGEAGAGEGAGGGAPAYKPPETQADLDRIVNERLARQKAQYKDYDTYKSAHDELEKIKAANQTDTEKAQARADAAEKAVAAATDRAVRAEVKAIATGEFADPNDAHLYLGDLSRFVGKDGEIDSAAIETALKEVEKAKPHLVARTRTDVGLGAREGAAPTGKHFMNEQIRQAAGR